MKFHSRQHKFYCGIDLHTSKMYLCVLDQEGSIRLHQNMKTSPGHLMIWRYGSRTDFCRRFLRYWGNEFPSICFLTVLRWIPSFLAMARMLSPCRCNEMMSIKTSFVIMTVTSSSLQRKVTHRWRWYTFHCHFWYTFTLPLTAGYRFFLECNIFIFLSVVSMIFDDNNKTVFSCSLCRLFFQLDVCYRSCVVQ